MIESEENDEVESPRSCGGFLMKKKNRENLFMIYDIKKFFREGGNQFDKGKMTVYNMITSEKRKLKRRREGIEGRDCHEC